jgi:hypothetical protein
LLETAAGGMFGKLTGQLPLNTHLSGHTISIKPQEPQ